MLIELHILQNFAPSNLNRDDTGSPKDCEFGGYRRARISSQCIKRAVRQLFKREKLIDESRIASRTKRLVEEIATRLVSKGKQEGDARSAVERLLGAVEVKVKEDGKTQYLLFVGAEEINSIADLCLTHWDALMASAGVEQGEKKQKAKAAKKAAREAIPEEIRKAMSAVFNGGRAADLALFGRMLADLPEKNIDAASQVAHALSTNKVSMEFDFYTAVDDLRPDDNQGSDMLGTVEFNSACFYRYANVDFEQLKKNLSGDDELARKTVEAFLRAFVSAIPTGKQNSMAAQNPPSLVFVVAREAGLCSLANAFVKPIRPTNDGDLVENSIKALDEYWGLVSKMYGEKGIQGKWVAAMADTHLNILKDANAGSVDQLVSKVMKSLSADQVQG